MKQITGCSQRRTGGIESVVGKTYEDVKKFLQKGGKNKIQQAALFSVVRNMRLGKLHVDLVGLVGASCDSVEVVVGLNICGIIFSSQVQSIPFYCNHQ